MDIPANPEAPDVLVVAPRGGGDRHGDGWLSGLGADRSDPDGVQDRVRTQRYAVMVAAARADTSLAELLGTLAAGRGAVRVVAAPRAWLAPRLSAFAPHADEVLALELDGACAAERLAWARARHPAVLQAYVDACVGAFHAALAPGAGTAAVLQAAAAALAQLPGVAGARLVRGPLESGAAGEAPEVSPDLAQRARERAGFHREGAVVVAPLGAGALAALRCERPPERHLAEPLLGAIARALETAALVEEQATRGFELARAVRRRSRAIERLRSRLARMNRSQDAMLSFLGHDLRTPLTVVVGHCQMLTEGILPPERRARSLETIRAQAERLGQMAVEAVDAQRALPDERGLDERVDLSALLADAIVRASAPTGRRDVRLRAAPHVGAFACGERPVIGDILDRMLHAALRQAEGGTEVLAQVRAKGGRLTVVVAHTGPPWPGSLPEAEATPAGRGLLAVARRAEERGWRLGVGARGGLLELDLPVFREASPARVVLVGRSEEATRELAAAFDGEAALEHHTFGPELALAADGPAVLVLDARGDPAPALRYLRARAVDAVAADAPVVLVADHAEAARAAYAVGAVSVVGSPGELRAAVARARSLYAGVEAWLDTPAGVPSIADVRERLDGWIAAARAAGRALPALVVSEIGPRLADPGRGRTLAEQLVAWLADELRGRASPGDLLAAVDAETLVWIAPGRTREALGVIWEELSEQLGRTRPRIGVTRVAVRARLEVTDLARTGDDPVSAMVVGMRSATEVGHAS